MPAFKPVPPELAERFESCLPKDDLVQRRKMFGCPCAFVNGNMFAGLHEDRVVLRLASDERERTLQQGKAKPFEVMGRTMREYVVLPSPMQLDAEEVASWISKAFAYGRALPPKIPKAPKTKSASSRKRVK